MCLVFDYLATAAEFWGLIPHWSFLTGVGLYDQQGLLQVCSFKIYLQSYMEQFETLNLLLPSAKSAPPLKRVKQPSPLQALLRDRDLLSRQHNLPCISWFSLLLHMQQRLLSHWQHRRFNCPSCHLLFVEWECCVLIHVRCKLSWISTVILHV